MVERKEYLEQLWEWKDEHIIKVVTGIRRCSRLKGCIPTNLFLKRLRLIIVNSHAKYLSC